MSERYLITGVQVGMAIAHAKGEGKMKLNFGSGIERIKGFMNIDVSKDVMPDVIWDMDEYPYPFEDNSADMILCCHTLEHLSYVDKTLKEFARILKVGGILHIKVPHYSSATAVCGNPQHKRQFSLGFRHFIEMEGFKTVFYRLVWGRPQSNVNYPIKWFPMKVFGFLASLHPQLCERFWCYLVGGFEEMELIMQKKEVV